MRKWIMIGVVLLSACNIDLRQTITVSENHHIGHIDLQTGLFLTEHSCGVDFISRETGQRVDVQVASYGVSENYILILDDQDNWWVVHHRETPTESEAGPMTEALMKAYLSKMNETWPTIKAVR